MKKFLLILLAPLATGNSMHAATLVESNRMPDALFGVSVSASGTTGLVGASRADNGNGSAYLFRSLDTATGTITENVKLVAADGYGNYGNDFGTSVSLAGTMGLVGASQRGNGFQGLAFVFQGLDTATGTVQANVTLIASGGRPNDRFGTSVSLSGAVGLVGASQADFSSGSAYVFRDLDTATEQLTQNAKLVASDLGYSDSFGTSVSLSGAVGLVGATRERNIGGNGNGSAYVFRDLDTATGTLTENAKLVPSDPGYDDMFGTSVSLAGAMGLVGASQENNYYGSAYLFRGLDTATGTITENVKLVASDGQYFDKFGTSVSLAGTVGLVGAIQEEVNNGSAYLFRGLDTATGTITENVKLVASDGAIRDRFGSSVGLSGDNFVIGASGADSWRGKAYSGTISSVTTLDAGNTSRSVDGISFVTSDDWIIGQTTDANMVTLFAGNSATVTNAGKAVYIGKNAGSDNNRLTINGTLTANSINVGATGNTGNTLVVNGSIGSSALILNSGSTLSGSGTVGSLTVGNGVTLSPGNSPGTLNVAGNLTWLAGGNYNWQTLDTVGTPGTQWDLISATGVLDLTALSIGSEFNINLWSLSSTGPDVNGNISNFNNTQPYQWLIATAAGGINGFTGSNQFLINTGAINGTAGFSNPLGGGTFNISQTGNNLYLNFAPSGGAPVPEPGTWAVGILLVGGAAASAWRRRNRRRN